MPTLTVKKEKLKERDAEALIAEAEALNRKIGKTLPDLVNEAKREGRA